MSGTSRYVRLRGLRFHLRTWGNPTLPLLVYSHGWLDTSATFSDVAELLSERFHVVVPDQRGYGYSEWPQDGYWFQDYLADLDALIDHLAPSAPFALVGHSMGGQVSSLYAGLRPERIAKLAVIDSLFLPDMSAEQAPRRMRRWLDQLKAAPREKSYDSFEALALRVQKQQPQLSAERALFVARGWAAQGADGQIRLQADPRHRLDMPTLYRNAESMEIWKQITAPTLFIDAGASAFAKAISAEETALRRACFKDHHAVVIADAGHMVHFDAPAALAAALLEFM
jgi:pimeloyl-ACP methyl ester carboxylesterase